MRFWGSLLVICSICLSACMHMDSRYAHKIKTWAKHAEVFNFDSMRAELIWDALLITDDLLMARRVKEADLRHISEQEADKWIPQAWREEGTLFYVNFFAPRDVKDLLADDSYWRVRLTDASGQEYKPLSIKQVGVSQIDRKLFPFLVKWSKAYVIRFPSVPQQGMRLKISGLNANSELRW